MSEQRISTAGGYRGWWIVATSAVGMSAGPGQFAFGALGLFMLPLAAEFGWSRTAISIALSCHSVALALSIPLIGRLVDRHGSRAVLLPSCAVFALLLAALALFVEQLWQLWLLFALIGSLAAGANSLPYLRTISAWFDRRRALALGLAMGGSGLGFVYVPPTVQYVIDAHGWRPAWLMLAAVVALFALPLAYFTLREAPSARDLEGRDELRAPRRDVPQAGAQLALGLLLRRALLWQLFVVFCLLSLALYGVRHLVPMLRDRGTGAGEAALVQSALGIAVVVSRIFIGYLMDRFFAPRVALVCFLLSTIGVALLALGPPGIAAFAAVLLIGLSLGAEMDMLAFLTGRYFGLANFGQVYGILFTAFLLGTSIGPVAFGMVFESQGSYAGALFASIGLMLVAAVVTARLPRYAAG